MAIATHGYDKTGPSLDIHVTYLSGARVGDVVEIEGVADKVSHLQYLENVGLMNLEVGRNISFTNIVITKIVNGQPGPIVAKGSHTKYFTPPPPTV